MLNRSTLEERGEFGSSGWGKFRHGLDEKVDVMVIGLRGDAGFAVDLGEAERLGGEHPGRGHPFADRVEAERGGEFGVRCNVEGSDGRDAVGVVAVAIGAEVRIVVSHRKASG